MRNKSCPRNTRQEISTSLEYESIAERTLVTVFAPLEVCGICLEPLLESKQVTVCRGVVQLDRTASRWRSGAGGHEIRIRRGNVATRGGGNEQLLKLHNSYAGTCDYLLTV